MNEIEVGEIMIDDERERGDEVPYIPTLEPVRQTTATNLGQLGNYTELVGFVDENPIQDLVMSPTVGKIFEALGKLQSEETSAVKDQTNEFFNSSYVDIFGVIQTFKPYLGKHGLTWLQNPTTLLDKEGKPWSRVTGILGHKSGEWIKLSTSMRIKDSGPHASGAGYTYCRRQQDSAVFQTFCEADDDANAAVEVKAPKKS